MTVKIKIQSDQEKSELTLGKEKKKNTLDPKDIRYIM
jgi:hypothetical protein